MAERYLILLEDDVPVDPRKYGDIVAPALGLTRLEAKMAVRKGRGIFLESLAEEDARKIAAELDQDGIKTRLVPREQVPPFPAPRKALQLERGDGLLHYRADGELEGVPWDALLVASVGVVALPKYQDLFSNVPFRMVPPIRQLEGADREVVRENLILKLSAPAAPEGKPKKPEAAFEAIEQKYGTKVKVYADLLSADLGTWLRVPLDEMAYAAVAGGVKLGGAWGFQILVKELRERAPDALTEMTLKLLNAADIKDLVFPQVEEFTRYTAWAALKRYLWPSAASSSPSPGLPGPSTDAGSSSASPGPGPASTSS